MADRLIVCPGLSPDLMHGVVLPPQMVDDLVAVARIPKETIDSISTRLEREVGFLDPVRLVAVLREVLTEEQLVSAAAAALQNLRPTSLQRTFESLRKWRTADARNAKRLPAEVLHDLEQTLPSLIGACPALLRYRKAARLANITGSTAQSIALICDARPVFNASRDVIEGMITLTTLTIAYEGEDEVTRSFEVHLTPEMLETLVEKAQQAQRKLSVLSESIGNWIPNGLAVFPE